jgi:hypothetical protein
VKPGVQSQVLLPPPKKKKRTKEEKFETKEMAGFI